jgi:hypothetical protein
MVLTLHLFFKDSQEMGLSLDFQISKPCDSSFGNIFFQIQKISNLDSNILMYITQSPTQALGLEIV